MSCADMSPSYLSLVFTVSIRDVLFIGLTYWLLAHSSILVISICINKLIFLLIFLYVTKLLNSFKCKLLLSLTIYLCHGL